MKTLLLIDANSIIHRSFHALPPFTTPDGRPSGALYGIASILLKLWREERPEYAAALFEDDGEVVAYALYREQPEEIYLRQLFVVQNRRRKGIGREAVKILRSIIWPKNKRLTVEVLVQNEAAVAFWRAVGYKDYSLTLEMLSE